VVVWIGIVENAVLADAVVLDALPLPLEHAASIAKAASPAPVAMRVRNAGRAWSVIRAGSLRPGHERHRRA
jgi:hypothetical protein